MFVVAAFPIATPRPKLRVRLQDVTRAALRAQLPCNTGEGRQCTVLREEAAEMTRALDQQLLEEVICAFCWPRDNAACLSHCLSSWSVCTAPGP